MDIRVGLRRANEYDAYYCSSSLSHLSQLKHEHICALNGVRKPQLESQMLRSPDTGLVSDLDSLDFRTNSNDSSNNLMADNQGLVYE